MIRLCQYLQTEKREYVLSKQILRSGTSIGANAKEATQAISRPDFINKMSIALKECAETEYWLELLHETDYLTKSEFQSLYSENSEIKKILSSILISTKENNNSHRNN